MMWRRKENGWKTDDSLHLIFSMKVWNIDLKSSESFALKYKIESLHRMQCSSFKLERKTLWTGLRSCHWPRSVYQSLSSCFKIVLCATTATAKMQQTWWGRSNTLIIWKDESKIWISGSEIICNEASNLEALHDIDHSASRKIINWWFDHMSFYMCFTLSSDWLPGIGFCSVDLCLISV